MPEKNEVSEAAFEAELLKFNKEYEEAEASNINWLPPLGDYTVCLKTVSRGFFHDKKRSIPKVPFIAPRVEIQMGDLAGKNFQLEFFGATQGVRMSRLKSVVGVVSPGDGEAAKKLPIAYNILKAKIGTILTVRVGKNTKNGQTYNDVRVLGKIDPEPVQDPEVGNPVAEVATAGPPDAPPSEVGS